MNYILASASPRRSELLRRTGLCFEILSSKIEEKITKSDPHEIVMELAFQKADAVFDTLQSSDIMVIGADTIVVYKDEILLKPCDEQEAYDMLSMLADRTHQVYTGVSLIIRKDGEKHVCTFYDSTDVTFYPIDHYDLLRYIQTKDPFDKAGAYGIQGEFAIHVKSICGDYNNVVGLPVSMLYQKLKQLGTLIK